MYVLACSVHVPVWLKYACAVVREGGARSSVHARSVVGFRWKFPTDPTGYTVEHVYLVGATGYRADRAAQVLPRHGAADQR